MLFLNFSRLFSGSNYLIFANSYNLTTLHFWFGDSIKSAIFCSIVYLIIGYLAYIFILEPIWRLTAGVINFQKLRHEERAFLEITPPHVSEKSSLATEQLFTVVEDFLCRRSSRGESHGVLSLEIVSTKEDGVRFILSVRSQSADTLQRHIASYLPEVRIKQVESPFAPLQNSNDTRYNIFEFGQQRHYAYPFKQQEDISQSDLVAYLLGSINKLQDNEATVLQIVISPHYSRWTRKLYNLNSRTKRNLR